MSSENYPKCLYRAYKNEAHANDFLNGKIICGEIHSYKTTDDTSRLDGDEGESRFKIPNQVLSQIDINTHGISYTKGNMYYSGTMLNPIYLFCTSSPEAQICELRRKYGNFVIKINNPQELLNDIQQAKTDARLISAELLQVHYTKDTSQPFNPTKKRPYVNLAYTQKPPRYKDDYEWRYAIKCEIRSDVNSDTPDETGKMIRDEIELNFVDRPNYLDKLW